MGRTFGGGAIWRACIASLLCASIAAAPAISYAQTTTNYRYDALGRLISSTNQTGNTSSSPIVYGYDGAGNRVSVGNGQTATELMPVAFSAYSTNGSSGLNTAAMRDERYAAADTVHITGPAPGQWIMADLGASKSVSTVVVAAASLGSPAVNEANLNGALLQHSTDGTNWQNGPTISAVPAQGPHNIPLGNVSARYWKISKPTGVLAIGDFRFFANSGVTPTPPQSGSNGGAYIKVYTQEFKLFDWRAGIHDGAPPYTLIFSGPYQALTKGDIQRNPTNGQMSYQAYAYTSGREEWDFTAKDATNATVNGKIVFEILPALTNLAPILLPDSVDVEIADTVNFYPLQNDVDPEGDTMRLVSVGQPENGGRITWDSSTGLVTYKSLIPSPGLYVVPYIVDDGRQNTTTGQITIKVNSPTGNRRPRPTDDVRLVTKNTPITFRPHLNDIDIDADPLFTTAVTDPPHGTATVGPGGLSVTYTPDLNYLGPDEFNYTVSDGKDSAVGKVSLTVSEQLNRAPVAVVDNYSLDFSPTRIFQPLQNDYDPDGDDIRIVSITQPVNGVTELISDWIVDYRPTVNWHGSDSIQYTISDNRGGFHTATVNVTVAPPPNGNYPAILNDDEIEVKANKPYSFDATANDVDPEGDPIRLVYLTKPAHGVASIGADQKTITYTPFTGYAGPDSFTYLSEIHRTANVVVTVRPNEPPTAEDDEIEVPGGPFVFDPRSNDTDPEEHKLIIVDVTDPPNGTAVAINGGLNIRYTPDNQYVGEDSFQYTISDGYGGTSTASVTVDVLQNVAPQAVNDEFSAPRDVAVPMDPRANDQDANQHALTIISVTQPNNGGMVVIDNSGGLVRYRSSSSFTGDETFDYTVRDPFGETSTATVKVSVHPRRFFAGSINNQSGWDLDIDGTLTIANLSVNGQVTTVTPSSNFKALVKAWGASGGTIGSAKGGAGAFLSGAVNFVQSTSYQLYAGWSGFPMDPGVHPGFGLPGGGQAGGFDSGGGGGWSGIQLATGSDPHILVAAGGGGAGAGGRGGAGGIATGQAGDAAGGGVAGAGATQSAGGQSIRGWGGNAGVWTAGAGGGGRWGGYAGTNSSGGGGGSSYYDGNVVSAPIDSEAGTWATPGKSADSDRGTAGTPSASQSTRGSGGKLIIYGRSTPLGGNVEPEAQDDLLVVDSGATATLNPLANDTDVNLDPLQITAYAGDPEGTVTIINSGKAISYVAPSNYVGSDSFTYTVSDGTLTDTATVAVTVRRPNGAPDAVADTIVVTTGVPHQFDPRDGDSDPQNDPLTVTEVTDPPHGTATVVSNGEAVVYVSDAGYVGSDSFSYTIDDGFGGTDTATVSVTVNHPAPVNEWLTLLPSNVSEAWDGGTNMPFAKTSNNNFQGWPTVTLQKSPTSGSPPLFTGAMTVPGSVHMRGVNGSDSWEISGGQRLGVAFEAKGVGATTHAAVTLYYFDQSWGALGDSTESVTTPISGAWGRVELIATAPPTAKYVAVAMMLSSTGDQRTAPLHGVRLRKPQFYRLATGQLIPAYSGTEQANTPPLAVNDNAPVVYQATTLIDVLANDADADSDDLTISNTLTDPPNGTATVSAGKVSYTPDTGFSGQDSFQYTITDGRGASSTGWVTATVGSVPITNQFATFTTAIVNNWWDGGTGQNYTPTLATENSFPTLTLQKTATGTPLFNGTMTYAGDVELTGAPGAGKWTLSGGERIGVAFEAEALGAITHLGVRFHYWGETWNDLGDSPTTTVAIGGFARRVITDDAPAGARYVSVVLTSFANGDQSSATNFGFKLRKPQFSVLPGGAVMPPY